MSTDSREPSYEAFLEHYSRERQRFFAYIYALLPHRADAEDVFQRKPASCSGRNSRLAILGATDDLGLHAVTDRVDVTDLHASILHLLGLGNMQLTYLHKEDQNVRQPTKESTFVLCCEQQPVRIAQNPRVTV